MKTIKKEYINSNEFTDLMTIASNNNDIAAFQDNAIETERIKFRLHIITKNKKSHLILRQEQYNYLLTKQEIHDLFDRLSKQYSNLTYGYSQVCTLELEDEKRDMIRSFAMIDGKINHNRLKEFLKD